mgnify:FL=1
MRSKNGHYWPFLPKFHSRPVSGPSSSLYTAPTMIRWFIVIFLALMLISWLTPLLGKLGFGKLPGDLRFRLFGRDWSIPLVSTILLSLLASTLSKLI